MIIKESTKYHTSTKYIKNICEEAAKHCMEQYRYYNPEQDKFITHQEVVAKQSSKSEPEPEPELCFPELMFFDNKTKDVELVQSWEDFVIGDKYYIWARRIKSKQRRMYILKHVIGMLNNDCLNICIMKQCSGPASMKFTLTEADCENIGIEFEVGLEVYPVNAGWVKCQPSKNKTNKEKPKTQSTDSYNYYGNNGEYYHV